MSAAKILVVEDEGLTAMELQRKLKFWGYEVPTFAFSRREAVKKAEEIKPDLILMDIILKGDGDGIDAAKEIRDSIGAPVIYLTAYSDKKTMKRAEVTEPYGFISKPFEDKELHESIDDALHRHGIMLKLKENGEWLDRKLENSGAAVVVTNAEGHITFMNRCAEIFTGFKLENVSFNDFIELLNLKMDAGEELSNQIQEVIKNGLKSGISNNSILRGVNGSEIPIEYNISPIKDDDGKFVGATLVFQDITEKVKAEKSLQESERCFKGIYYQSTVGMEIYEMDGSLVDSNKAALDLFGTSDTSGLSEFNLFKDFKMPPDKKEKLLNGEAIKYQTKFDFKDYKSFKTTKSDFTCLEIDIKAIEIDGAVGDSSKLYLAQFKDLTEYKTVENSLKAIKKDHEQILKSIAPIFFVLNKELRCTHWNDTAQNFTGILDQDAIGKPIFEVLKDISGEDVQELYLKTLKTQKPGFIVKKCIINGYSRFFEINVYPYLMGLSVLIRDVTDSKVHEEELEQSEKLYRSILDDQTEPICRLDTLGKLTFSNDVYKAYFGDGEEGNFVFSLKEEDKKRMKDYINSFDEKNQVKLFESPMIVSNGDVRWWQWVTKTVLDLNGKIKEFQFVGHDVTRQKKIEEEMNEVICQLELEIKNTRDDFKTAKESLKSQIKDLNDEILNSKHYELSLEKKRDELEKNVKKTSDDFLNVKTALEKQLKENEKTRNSYEKELKSLEKEIAKKTVEFEKAKEALETDLNERNVELKRVNEDLKSRISKNKELELNLEEQVKESRRAQDSFESDRAALEEEFSVKYVEFEKTKEVLETDLNERNVELKRVDEDLKSKISQNKELELNFEKTQKNLQEQLKSERSEFEKTKEKLRADLERQKIIEKETKAALHERETLLKNVHNQVKKNMQMISSLTGLQSEYIRDQIMEKFRDSQNHIKSIALVHEKLYESPNLEEVNFSGYIKSLVEDLSRSHGVDQERIKITVRAEDVFLDIDTAVSSGLIVNELISNSFSHAFPGNMRGEILLKIDSDSDQGFVMKISDNGVGLPENFDLEKAETLGLQLVKTLVRQLGGELRINSPKGNHKGTEFIIKLKNS